MNPSEFIITTYYHLFVYSKCLMVLGAAAILVTIDRSHVTLYRGVPSVAVQTLAVAVAAAAAATASTAAVGGLRSAPLSVSVVRTTAQRHRLHRRPVVFPVASVRIFRTLSANTSRFRSRRSFKRYFIWPPLFLI